MHVVHIVPTLRGGGAETLVRAIVPRLIAEDIRVSVVSVYDPGISAPERAALAAPLYVIGRRGIADAPSAFLRAVALLRDLRPDLVHGHVHTGKYFGRAAAIAAGVPHILYTEHHSRPEASIAQRVADWALQPHTDIVVAFHERQRAQISRRDHIPIARIAVVPNGVACDPCCDPGTRARMRASLGIEAADFVVLFAGRLGEEKDPLLAVRAFAAMPASAHRRAMLVIAGSGPLEAAVASCAAPLGTAVTMLGFRPDMHDLFAIADVYLMTSRNEAMPLAPLEAMSQRVPVVTTPWDGAEDLMHNGECSFVARTSEAAELGKLLALTRDFPAWSRSLAERAAIRVRTEYEIGSTARKYRALYQTLVGAS